MPKRKKSVRHVGPAAEDLSLVRRLRVVLKTKKRDFQRWVHQCLRSVVSEGEIPLSRIGRIGSVDIKIEPGESYLVWERYFGDERLKLDLDEVVTILDEGGHQLVRQAVERFSREELVKYCGNYFWILEEDPLACSRVIGLSPAGYAEIEGVQNAKQWRRQFKGACREAGILSQPGTWLEFYPEVITVSAFDSPIRYLAHCGSAKPLLDAAEVRVFDRGGREVCRKDILDFTEGDFIAYCTDHIWSYSIND